MKRIFIGLIVSVVMMGTFSVNAKAYSKECPAHAKGENYSIVNPHCTGLTSERAGRCIMPHL